MLFPCLFIWQRATGGREWTEGKEEGGADPALSAEPKLGLDPTAPRWWPEMKSKVGMLNWLSHPAAPEMIIVHVEITCFHVHFPCCVLSALGRDSVLTNHPRAQQHYHKTMLNVYHTVATMTVIQMFFSLTWPKTFQNDCLYYFLWNYCTYFNRLHCLGYNAVQENFWNLYALSWQEDKGQLVWDLKPRTGLDSWTRTSVITESGRELLCPSNPGILST